MLRLILFFFSLITFESIQAQDYIPGQLIYHNGKIEEGYIKSFYSNSSKIEFKKSLDEKT